MTDCLLPFEQVKKRKDLIPKPLAVNSKMYKSVKYYPLITSRQDDAPNFSMRLFELGPDGYTGKHKHSYEHEVYILSGSGIILKGEAQIKIEKDDCIFIPPYEIHQLLAGKDGINFICVVPNKLKNQPD